MGAQQIDQNRLKRQCVFSKHRVDPVLDIVEDHSESRSFSFAAADTAFILVLDI